MLVFYHNTSFEIKKCFKYKLNAIGEYIANLCTMFTQGTFIKSLTLYYRIIFMHFQTWHVKISTLRISHHFMSRITRSSSNNYICRFYVLRKNKTDYNNVYLFDAIVLKWEIKSRKPQFYPAFQDTHKKCFSSIEVKFKLNASLHCQILELNNKLTHVCNCP